MALRNPLNRPMRTRMSVGVAGESGRPLPLCVANSPALSIALPLVQFLASCEANGTKLENGPLHIRQIAVHRSPLRAVVESSYTPFPPIHSASGVNLRHRAETLGHTSNERIEGCRRQPVAGHR